MKQSDSAAPALDQPPRAKRLQLRDARSHLKLGLVRASKDARAASGLSQRDLAADIGVQQSMLARCERAHEPHAPTVLHVVASSQGSPAARSWASEVVRWQASQLSLVVLEQAADQHGDNHHARLAAVTVECTDLPRALALALVDNELSTAELELLVRESREAAQAALEAHARYSAELARRRAAGE